MQHVLSFCGTDLVFRGHLSCEALGFHLCLVCNFLRLIRTLGKLAMDISVSYTHLTLPTIYSV